MAERTVGRRGWLGSMRVRILAVVIGLLLLSSVGSVLLLRTVLFERLDEQVQLDLDKEAAEFRLLSAGNDPQTGDPFDGDLRGVFDVYFRREIPNEGEALLAFVDGETVRVTPPRSGCVGRDRIGAGGLVLAVAGALRERGHRHPLRPGPLCRDTSAGRRAGRSVRGRELSTVRAR